jgi:dTDP-4-dehydrorhamnose reductase
VRILIIGGTGLLGKALLEEWNLDQALGVGSRDADIRNSTQLRALFAWCQPEWTVLAAAYTDVDGCEKNSELAHQVNCVGAINVARAAREAGSRLLFLSTDYVFDGSKRAPYDIDDPVRPINAYGRSKAEAEKGVREILPDCCILRTSWLFGASGRCFPNTILELAQSQKTLSVVADQTGSPTFNRDLARTIVKLVRANARGTIHATNAGECTWHEFACEVVRSAGLVGLSIEAIRSRDLLRPASRPKYSVLSGASLEQYGLRMRPWRETLGGYLSERLRIFGTHAKVGC